nr:cytochrome P450 [uncultured Rhodoferax sp.]
MGHTPDFFSDPYPAYKKLREAGPIHWSKEYFGGSWVLTRHRDVEALLRDRRFSAQRLGRPNLLGGLPRALLFLDAPDHTRVRSLLMEAFRGDALQLLGDYIEQTTDALLDDIDSRRPFDFVAKVARPLPLRVIARVLGVDAVALAEMQGSSEALAEMIGSAAPDARHLRRAVHGMREMREFFRRHLASHVDTPSVGLLGSLTKALADGRLQDEADLLTQCAMLLFAGHETTRNLLGNALLALMTNPVQWELLRREPDRIPGAVRELLRYDSPVQYTVRSAGCDMHLMEQFLRKGDLVIALIGSANRDPERHAEPDRLDVTRADPAALAFGSGPHVCLGAALTRMEAEVVLRKMLSRWPELPSYRRELTWMHQDAFRGMQKLVLTLQ